MWRLAIAALFVQVAIPGVAVAKGLTLHEAIDGAWRTPAFVTRDRYRKPEPTLEFFGLRPDLTVVELAPGGGWWTEILAPYLRADGRLIEAIPPASSTGFAQRLRSRFVSKMKASPVLYGRVEYADFAPPAASRLAAKNSVDLVLTFRNLHNWQPRGNLPLVFKTAYAALKRGGVFGVVEHRALPYADPDVSAKALHRLSEGYVIRLALQTGFQLAGISQVHANPKDPLTINVHHLLPGLHDVPSDKKAEYEAIGESDLMTLKFVKP